MLKSAYGEKCLSRTSVFDTESSKKSGNLEDDERERLGFQLSEQKHRWKEI